MKNYQLPIYLTLALGLFVACNPTKKTVSSSASMEDNEQPIECATKYEIVSAPIVKKPFLKKNGEVTDFEEYYLRRSIQDYFIKFCEGKVSQKKLEAALKEDDGMVKTLKLEVEFLEGEWDICPDDPAEMQSRIGEYVVIHRIIK